MAARVCVPCDKGNHRYCLARNGEVEADGSPTECECGTCEDNQLREEQTHGGDRRGSDYT
jgi:hypothetical protein